MKLLAIALTLLLTFGGLSTLALAESTGSGEESYSGSEAGREAGITPAQQGMENDPNLGVMEPEKQAEEPAGEAGSEDPLLPLLPFAP